MNNSLLSKRKPANPCGRTQFIDPTSAGWNHVGFEVYEFETGRSVDLHTQQREFCVVLLGGRATVEIGRVRFENIGQRTSPFDRTKPYAVYVPPGQAIRVVAISRLEIAVCSAPSCGTHPTRLIRPEDIGIEQRGKGCNRRLVHNILPDTAPADSLLVVEVYTDEGNTSSYPSHKHDQDAQPLETALEETYYHRLDPPQGFSFQRVYTADGEIDETMTVHDGDVVMVPRGYHPVATVAGYDNYYLNTMAGPVRKWCFTWESAHAWVNGPDYPRKLPR
jgi:5-deoxy-glucuronate isomerase